MTDFLYVKICYWSIITIAHAVLFEFNVAHDLKM